MLATERLVGGSGEPQPRAAAAPPRRCSGPCGCRRGFHRDHLYRSTAPRARAPHIAAARGSIGVQVSETLQGSRGTGRALSVEFRKATKLYPGADQPAVRELDLEVPAGEICVFVGPSGCGKTTAMRMVNRMVEITEGDILVGGDLRARPLALRAAARDRLRDPADRAVPASHDRPEHRHGPAACSAGTATGRGSGRGAARVDIARPRSRGPLPGAALGRPAAARRGGPRARRRPAA